MNGPIKMYRTKQIVRHDIPVKLPTCMYKLKVIHSGRNGTIESSDHVSPPNKKLDIIDQSNQHNPGMAELEAKQEEILKQLAELKEQILSMKSNLKLSVLSSEQNSVNHGTTICSKKLDVPDIVVKVNPLNPPYSLVVIQKLLSDVVALRITSHLHSTVSTLPEKTEKFLSDLLDFKQKSNVLEIHMRLIWKNINSNVEVLISFVPIMGEVNLLRYLASVVPSLLSYTEEADSIEVDSVLDLCHQIVRAKTKTEKTNLLQSLNKSLGKSQWLLGRDSVGIADIAAYSVIQQVSNSSELNVNLGKWFQRCSTVFTA